MTPAEAGKARSGAFFRLFVPFLPAVATLLFIRLLFHRNSLLFFVLLAIFLASLYYRFRPLKAAVAFWAVLLGIFGEWSCVKAGMWVYAHPQIGGLPVWLGFVWPILMMSFLEMAEYLDEAGEAYPRARLAGIAVLLPVALFLTGAALALAGGPVSLILFLFLSFALVFAHRPFHLILFVMAAAIGFSGEYLCVRWGVWHYTRPFLEGIGMPVSLPLAWGLSALLVRLAAGATIRPLTLKA